PDVDRVTAFLGLIVGAPPRDGSSPELRMLRGDATALGDQVTRAVLDLLEAECAAQPVVLLLEDLQWGDLPTVRVVDGALGWLREAALMVIALGRPDLRAVFPSLWCERAPLQMSLGELDARASEDLVRQILGSGAPAATVSRVIRSAAGNALYLE